MAEREARRRGARMTTRIKAKILDLRAKMSVEKVRKTLEEQDGLKFSRQGIYAFLTSSKTRSSLARKPRIVASKHFKLKPIHVKMMDNWLSANPELTAPKLRRKLKETFGVEVSLGLISLRRREIGWKAQTSARTCQMISHKNKRVRMQWCLDALRTKEDFRNVIFVDESSVEISSNGRLFFHKPSSDIQKKCNRVPKPKHAYKVHVWAGISYRGRTSICIFSGIMDSLTYQQILQDNLLPFVNQKFPDGFRLYQDNDSKHNSRSTKAWLEDNNILECVMPTPASSPDLNPIENVWASMKHFLQTEAKPKTRDDLVLGIRTFWESLTAEKCASYIDHIHKVIPYVVLNDGESSGF